MQYLVFPNPSSVERPHFPYVAVLQSDFADTGDTRLVALLTPDRGGVRSGLFPLVVLGGLPYRLLLPTMVGLPVRGLKTPLGSIAAHQNVITRGLDLLFQGC